MKYIVYIANADRVNRFDTPGKEFDISLENWEAVATGETADETLQDLLQNANDEMFDITNSWLRLEVKEV